MDNVLSSFETIQSYKRFKESYLIVVLHFLRWFSFFFFFLHTSLRSVGGHGAFLSAFKNPYFYRSLSALAPVCDIVKAPHSSHALESYLGPQFESNWEEWSAINLASCYEGPPLHILIDQVIFLVLIKLICIHQMKEAVTRLLQ